MFANLAEVDCARTTATACSHQLSSIHSSQARPHTCPASHHGLLALAQAINKRILRRRTNPSIQILPTTNDHKKSTFFTPRLEINQPAFTNGETSVRIVSTSALRVTQQTDGIPENYFMVNRYEKQSETGLETSMAQRN